MWDLPSAGFTDSHVELGDNVIYRIEKAVGDVGSTFGDVYIATPLHSAVTVIFKIWKPGTSLEDRKAEIWANQQLAGIPYCLCGFGFFYDANPDPLPPPGQYRLIAYPPHLASSSLIPPDEPVQTPAGFRPADSETFPVGFFMRLCAENDAYVAMRKYGVQGPIPTTDYPFHTLDPKKRAIKTHPSFPDGVVGTLAYPVLVALRDMHAAGFAHFDFKPENILVDSAGDAEQGHARWLSAVLGDLGFVQYSPDGKFAKPRGTRHYAAPELRPDCTDDITTAVDMWAVGATLYVMAVGIWPFWDMYNPDDWDEYWVVVREVRGRVRFDWVTNADLRELIMNLMVVEPDKRWSAEAVLASKFMEGAAMEVETKGVVQQLPQAGATPVATVTSVSSTAFEPPEGGQ
jgi:serine/threonine protein kinase